MNFFSLKSLKFIISKFKAQVSKDIVIKTFENEFSLYWKTP